MTDDITEPKPFPRILPSIGWIVVYLLVQVIVTVAVIASVIVSHPDLMKAVKAGDGIVVSNPVIAQSVLWGLLISGVITLALLWFNLRKDGRAAQIGLFASSKLNLGTTLGTGVALIAGAFALNWVYTTYIIPGVELQDELRALLKALPATPLNFILKYVAVAMMAPVIEELIFRGYLQNSFKSSMNRHAAIWLGAFVFACIHFQPLATPALMVLGAAFGYLYDRTGSLKTNIVLHCANNALALFLS